MALDLRDVEGITRQEQGTTPALPTTGESGMPMMNEGTTQPDGGAPGTNPDKPIAGNVAQGSTLGGGRNVPPPPVPVPPPPVQFNVAGSGGGEGASSFARPGSAAARPFRSMNFVQSRMAGAGPSEMGQRRVGFGAGAALAGGAAPATSMPGGFGDAAPAAAGPGEDDLARLLAQIAGRYQGGQ